MMTYLMPKLVCGHPAVGLGWLSWVSLCCVVVSGCVSMAPETVLISPGQTSLSGEFEDGDPASLTVTTFNVWGLPSWLNGASAGRFRRIARELPHLGSDVVLLQEVWTRRCFTDLSEGGVVTNRLWWTASARHKRTFLGQNGLLTLSKYPIINAAVMHFSSGHLPDSLMHKGALKVTIKAGRHLFNVWNVHLQDGASEQVRSGQRAELIHWIQQCDDGQDADIVGGDFNFQPGSKEFAKITKAIGPSVHELAGEPALPTWDGLKIQAGAGQVLDHIFIRMRQPRGERAIRASARRIFTAKNIADRLSDHMGMEARMTFGNAPTVGSLDRLVAPSLLEPAASTYLETSAFTPTGIGMTVQNQ
jgi:endonuclease/exonuclease/phosphatase family metal-dependent hydrolase